MTIAVLRREVLGDAQIQRNARVVVSHPVLCRDRRDCCVCFVVLIGRGVVRPLQVDVERDRGLAGLCLALVVHHIDRSILCPARNDRRAGINLVPRQIGDPDLEGMFVVIQRQRRLNGRAVAVDGGRDFLAFVQNVVHRDAEVGRDACRVDGDLRGDVFAAVLDVPTIFIRRDRGHDLRRERILANPDVEALLRALDAGNGHRVERVGRVHISVVIRADGDGDVLASAVAEGRILRCGLLVIGQMVGDRVVILVRACRVLAVVGRKAVDLCQRVGQNMQCHGVLRPAVAAGVITRSLRSGVKLRRGNHRTARRNATVQHADGLRRRDAAIVRVHRRDLGLDRFPLIDAVIEVVCDGVLADRPLPRAPSIAALAVHRGGITVEILNRRELAARAVRRRHGDALCPCGASRGIGVVRLLRRRTRHFNRNHRLDLVDPDLLRFRQLGGHLHLRRTRCVCNGGDGDRAEDYIAVVGIPVRDADGQRTDDVHAVIVGPNSARSRRLGIGEGGRVVDPGRHACLGIVPMHAVPGIAAVDGVLEAVDTRDADAARQRGYGVNKIVVGKLRAVVNSRADAGPARGHSHVRRLDLSFLHREVVVGIRLCQLIARVVPDGHAQAVDAISL